MKNNLIAIGDIHGEIEKLNSLIKNLQPQKNDTLVFLGDYIDRGNNSKEVINRLIELSQKTNCIFLKGNHEDMLLKILTTKDEEDITHWLLSGGVTTYDNYGGFPAIFGMHRDFFENLKLYYLTDEYLFVHAGINPNKTLEEQDKDDLLWIRNEFIEVKNKFKETIIFGHTPFKTPFIFDNKIGIDTSCGKEPNAKLTAFICNENKFITSD